MGKLLDLAKPDLSVMTDEEKLMSALSLHNTRHILYPPFLKRADDLPNLQWNKVPFCKASRARVPREKGVYAFVLEFSHNFLPNSSHVLYIGKGGDITSKNNLWKRYYDYMRTEKKNDRPRIHEMLCQWKGHLTYYYATVDQGVSTGTVEETLLDVLIPPYNRGDFSAELTDLLKGANIL
ncbi:hypothetical protein [Vibrio cyclitrophicus]|uniref:hypothetical protein n=1 Tax=Vibrio cyclitrophicus TaxID=47951 RepID=UPI00148E5C96|nr:hypothetical protein [Vibrio cyclitrophicus]NOH18502.1 hypothetical protein [Vibrio cyclitrophicus]